MSIKNFEDMRRMKADIATQLNDLALQIDKLNAIGIDIDGQGLMDLESKLENDTFKVMVIGEFKRGKSTFVNALLGDEILPAYSRPCTAVINEVKYGAKERATLFFKNPLPNEMSKAISELAIQYIKKYEGKEIPPMPIDVSRLKDYVAIPDPTKKQADSISELPYSKVVLEYPIEICRNGIEIIDSPGLNENATRTKVTQEYLDSADAILFVLNCTQLWSQGEKEYVCDNIQARGHKDIFFICNKIDQIDEDEREDLMQYGNGLLVPMTALGKDGIFYVDSKGALKAKKQKDIEKLSKTGMPAFENSLSEYLRNNKGRTKLLQVIEPCGRYITVLRNQHIESYIRSLDQNFDEIEKKIKDASPKLERAEERKELVVQKIDLAMKELKKKVRDSMDIQYGNIISNMSEAVDNIELNNHMTVNPFKQKEKKEALEKEVISNLEGFVQSEMGQWIKMDLNQLIDGFIDDLQRNLGTDIDIFYENLDEFRYAVSGVEKPKDISGFERVSATIVGTIVGGPTYGMLGATLGLGEIAKRSAITVGASFAAGAILAFTPVGIATITAGATIALLGSGILQLATGGEALTKKYKKQLKDSFSDKLMETREESCNTYASNIVNDVRKKFDLVVQALDNEITIEKSKVDALKKDREKSAEERKEKLKKLTEIDASMAFIEKELKEIERKID